MTISMAITKKAKIASVSKVIEQWEPLGTVDGSKNCTALWKTIWRFLKKLKIELPYDITISLLVVIHPQKILI